MGAALSEFAHLPLLYDEEALVEDQHHSEAEDDGEADIVSHFGVEESFHSIMRVHKSCVCKIGHTKVDVTWIDISFFDDQRPEKHQHALWQDHNERGSNKQTSAIDCNQIHEPLGSLDLRWQVTNDESNQKHGESHAHHVEVFNHILIY